ncbi:hypothetical protein ALC56_09969, partial [Trachymyrmex septentrionalis]
RVLGTELHDAGETVLFPEAVLIAPVGIVQVPKQTILPEGQHIPERKSTPWSPPPPPPPPSPPPSPPPLPPPPPFRPPCTLVTSRTERERERDQTLGPRVFTHSVALLGRMVSGSTYVRDTCTCDNKLVPVNSSNLTARIARRLTTTVLTLHGYFKQSDVNLRSISR